MSDATPLRLELRLLGSLVDNSRLPLSELERIAGRIRTTLRDVAIVLSDYGPSGRGGRVKKFIEQSVDLNVVGSPRTGSFVLELEAPAGAGHARRLRGQRDRAAHGHPDSAHPHA